MDKEKIICLMHKCYKLSHAIADLEIKMDETQKELTKTLNEVFGEYRKDEKNKTAYVKC